MRGNDTSLTEFKAFHAPALALDEVKHGVMLSALARAAEDGSDELSYWTLGGPGQCAVMPPPHAIVLGALDENQCRELADTTADTNYPGVVGPDLTAKWFTDRALETGLRFLPPVARQIHSISGPPRYPGSAGHARTVTVQDAPLFAEWLLAFHAEAVPHEVAPTRQQIERIAGDGRFLFWIDGGEPVSMAGIVRPLTNSGAISGVYTPPAFRGRGYAGSVTAAAVERIQSSGRTIASLYADRNNPYSNRCYARIGFTPACKSLHFYRPVQPAQIR
jgi:RimJ/RimL family protein N-acetyltransferase